MEMQDELGFKAGYRMNNNMNYTQVRNDRQP